MDVKEWLGEDNWIGFDIFEKKYRKDEESFAQWLERISGGNGEVKQLILEKKFLFGGRILANRGLDTVENKYTLSNCYVLPPPEDNIESIYDTASKLARTFSYGGGVGIDLGKLRPAGMKVKNAAKTTSGAVSFMELFNKTTELIGTQGRRGALMLSMPVNHPDIEEFITSKEDIGKLNNCNISVRIDDDFMKAVYFNGKYDLRFSAPETKETVVRQVGARKLFDKLCEMNYKGAEPGILFWDTIQEQTLLEEDDNFSFAGVNPCLTGDTLISTTRGKIQIKDLVGETPWVYCLDEAGIPIIIRASKIWKTRENAQIMRVKTAYNSLKCTPDHKIYVQYKGWVAASDLEVGDELVTLDSKVYPVETVSYLENREDVYDMTVPEVHNFIANDIVVHNCAEEPLPAGGSCLLGAINLSEFVKKPFTSDSYFDKNDFRNTVIIAVKALNEVLDEGLPLHPLEIQRKNVSDWRQIGLGIMGLADCLIKLGLTYGSKEANDFCDWVASNMFRNAVWTSEDLGLRYGDYEKFNRERINASRMLRDSGITVDHLRNSQLLTIAPTGTISTMLGVSGGIEPIFANSYNRTTKSLHRKDVTYKIYTPIVKQYMEEHHCTENELPDYFVTAHDIDPFDRIKCQSAWQTWIDASISSTINLPESATVEDIKKIYMTAWKHGLKGVTIYREGCDRAPILDDNKNKRHNNAPDAPNNAPDERNRGFVKKSDDSSIGVHRRLVTGCGTLWLHIYFDRNTGDLIECFVSKGSAGGCGSSLVGLSRMVSLALRGGVSLEDVVDQLKSADVCESYKRNKNASKGRCCPSAIGYALLDANDEMKRIRDSGLFDTVVEPKSSKDEDIEIADPKCPQCGEFLLHLGGCVQCASCGWSRCG